MAAYQADLDRCLALLVSYKMINYVFANPTRISAPLGC